MQRRHAVADLCLLDTNITSLFVYLFCKYGHVHFSWRLVMIDATVSKLLSLAFRTQCFLVARGRVINDRHQIIGCYRNVPVAGLIVVLVQKHGDPWCILRS